MAKIVSVEEIGEHEVFDISMPIHHNFFASGVMVHNCMKLSQVVAGFTPSESNKLRKAMGKKLPDVMAKMRKQFLEGSKEKGILNDVDASKLYDEIESMSAYCFNKSHAVCYSAISAQQMWLKHNYPLYYMTALLNCTGRSKEKTYLEDKAFVHYVKQMRGKGTIINHPSVNAKKSGFHIDDDDSIRYSLEHIKGVSGSAEDIVKNGPYLSFNDFLIRGSSNKRVVEALIYSGGFEEFETDKNKLFEKYLEFRDKKEKHVPLDKKALEAQEIDHLGLSLSRIPLEVKYSEWMEKNDIFNIYDAKSICKVTIICEIMDIVTKISKASKKDYFSVKCTDGLSEMSFSVFQNSMSDFQRNYKIGDVCTVPLSCFDSKPDGLRFYDSRGNRCQIPF